MLVRAAASMWQHAGRQASRQAIAGTPFSTKGAADVPAAVLAKARKLSLAVGTLAGAFGSLVGVGGGVLIAPVILNTCPAIPQRVISGTSLAAVATTGATAGYVYWSSSNVDWTSAALLASGAVLTARMGARATHVFDCDTLRRALGYWLYSVAPLVPLKAYLMASQTSDGDPTSSLSGQAATQSPSEALVTSSVSSGSSSSSRMEPAHREGQDSMEPGLLGSFLGRSLRPADAGIAATGCLAGFASGLLGIGGGTVVTPLLAVFTGMPQTQVLGTSLAAMVLPSLVGLAQHQRLGNVEWRMAAALALGTSAGSYVGSLCAIQAPPGALEAVFAFGMLFLGRKTLTAAAGAAKKAAAAAKKAAAAAATGTSR